jgi:hypothetical protein
MVNSVSAGVSCRIVLLIFVACRSGLGKRRNIPWSETACNHTVIANEAKQSRATRTTLDCFGALRLAMTR